MKKLFLLLSLVSCIASCNQPKCDCSDIPALSQEIIALEREVGLTENKLYALYDTLGRVNYEKLPIPENSVAPEITSTETDIKILRTGFFQEEYLNIDILNQKWVGLFVDSTGASYLKSVSLQLNKAHDPMIDQPDDTTGWVLSSQGKPKPTILISGISLNEGDIPSLEPPTSTLYPGQLFSFQMNNEWYYIRATGTADRGITNYSLQFSSSNKARHSETIVHANSFDDEMINIIWLGDLDNDKKPDLLLNISTHYNVTHMALLLSSIAPNDNLVTKVAELRTVGC